MDNRISILSFNVNGLSNKDKRLRLKEFVKIHKPDILQVVDTRIRDARVLSSILGAHSFHAAPPSCGSGGSGVFLFSIRVAITGVSVSPCGNILRSMISALGFSFTLISIYAPANVSERTLFFRHSLPPVLVGLTNQDNLILSGDFNFVESL